MNLWKEFTDEVIQYIDKHNSKCVFLLLGNFAKSKASLITQKNRIVTEVHPSPLARGFVGSNVFQRVEQVLGESVNWSIEPSVDSLCSQIEKLEIGKKYQSEPDVTMYIDTDSTKRTIYIDCDPEVFGFSKYPITLDYSVPKPIESKAKAKMTRLERICADPQTKGEEAVKIYIEYCKDKAIQINLDDVNAILIST